MPLVLLVPVTVMFLAVIRPVARVPQVVPTLPEVPLMLTSPALAVTVLLKLMAEPVLDCPLSVTLPAVAVSAPVPA